MAVPGTREAQQVHAARAGWDGANVCGNDVAKASGRRLAHQHRRGHPLGWVAAVGLQAQRARDEHLQAVQARQAAARLCRGRPPGARRCWAGGGGGASGGCSCGGATAACSARASSAAQRTLRAA
jgi:hypothetical protein